jgi:RsiW-degrading membrane proteinase PrsW (M82 family)
MSLSFSVIFLAVFLGFAPGIFWLWFYRQRDKKNPEPNKLMLLLFAGGMAATIPAALIQYFIQEFIPGKYLLCLDQGCNLNIGANILFVLAFMFLVVAPSEEIFKYLFTKWISFKSKHFDQIIDGIKYSVAVALGFASLENVLYLVGSLSVADFDTVVSTLLTRFFISTLAHTLYAGVMGYYIGRARFDEYHRKSLLRTGLLLAIVVHGTFNFLLYTDLGYYSIILVAIIFAVLIQKFRSRELTQVRQPAISPGVKRVSQAPEGEAKGIKELTQESQQKAGQDVDQVTISEFCPRCFKKNLHRSKFCPNCGEKLFIRLG